MTGEPKNYVDLTSMLEPTLGLIPEPAEEAIAEHDREGASERVRGLDRHTRLFLRLVQGAVSDWNKSPPGAEDVTAPQNEGKLPTVKLPFGGIELPSRDEDWPSQGIVRAAAVRFLRSRILPLTDRDEAWSSIGEALAAFEETLPIGTLRGHPNTHWSEMSSDEAMSRLAFSGLGALRLLPVRGDDPDGAKWVSDLAFMSAFDVRPGFERYGAIAYFDASQRIVRIHWSHSHVDVRPGDADWEHAKWAWRCTLLVGTTIVDHLVGVHWMIGNFVTSAARSSFGRDHPLRRLLKPFTWRTITINYSATFSLCPERGFVHRAAALTSEALTAAFQESVGLIRYLTVPELIGRKQAEGMGDDFPWATDGLALYQVTHTFVEDYISQYFAGDTVARDPQVKAFWAAVRAAAPGAGIPELSRVTLVELLAQFIWCVTGLHESVGALAEYLSNPAFMGTKIRPGREVSDVQASFQALLIGSLTGLVMPGILNDFSHVCLDKAGAQAFDRFQVELHALATRIDEANKTRRWPCNAFNPRFLECSISV